MLNMDIKTLINRLRVRIEDDYSEYSETYSENIFEIIDNYINNDKYSDLEKAFYLILNQYPSDMKNYFVKPNEMVLIPDVYDMGSPGIEYEVDFAIYGGVLNNPVKIAIECDGIRSHRQKHSNKDRKKDVNFQAAGWIVIRFGSNEIHEELAKHENQENYTSDFLQYIENVINETSQIITWRSYAKADFRSRLTGYKWGYILCPLCGKSQMGELNHIKHVCRHCGEKFKREVISSENVKYEHNGILYFD